MIYLHKLLPLLFLPLGLSMILVAAGILLRRSWVVAAGLVVLFLFSNQLVAQGLIRFLERDVDRIPASESVVGDAIVVLSGSGLSVRGVSRVVEWGDPDRFQAGVELFQAGKAPCLIFTGGWLPWISDAEPEGDVLLQKARLLGIPGGAMATTGKVSNTEEEAVGISRLLGERNTAEPNVRPHILLVTSAFHMQRARLIFERNGLEVTPFPVDFKSSQSGAVSLLDLFPSAGALNVSELALREFYGRLYYRMKP